MSYNSDLSSCSGSCSSAASSWYDCINTNCNSTDDLSSCSQDYCNSQWQTMEECVENCDLKSDIPAACDSVLSEWGSCIETSCENCGTDQSCLDSCLESCESDFEAVVECLAIENCISNKQCNLLSLLPSSCDSVESTWSSCIETSCENCGTDQSCLDSCLESCESDFEAVIQCIGSYIEEEVRGTSSEQIEEYLNEYDKTVLWLLFFMIFLNAYQYSQTYESTED